MTIADRTGVIRRRFGVATAAIFLVPAILAATSLDPFAWLRPAVSMDAAARLRMDRGAVVSKVLPAVDAEVGIVAAARLNADSEMLVAWASSIEQLKRSPYVLMVRRFSDPPSLRDVDTLALDDGDLEDLRRCQPGDCQLKIAADDIVSLRHTMAAGGPLWKEAVQRQFRQLVVNRVIAYQLDGFAALPAYADRHRPVDPTVAFGGILSRSPYLGSDAFEDADTESFFYWSKEDYGTGKPVIGVTHVDIVRPRGAGAVRVAVVSREILATHYRNASLGLTAVADDGTGRRYLVYVNRSQLDVLGGLFGAWKRSIVEGRLKSESADVLDEVRRRLESGPPPE